MDAQEYIGTNLRIQTVDGRQLDGVLTVVDPFGNMLLSNVFETSQDKLDTTQSHTRELGLVSVPRKQVEAVLMDKKQADGLEKTDNAT